MADVKREGRMDRPRRISIVTALLTPFDDRGEVDHEVLRAHVDDLISGDVDGIMPCGTSGEGPLLNETEAVAVVETVVQAAAGRVPVLAHVGRAATHETVRLGRHATDAGAAALAACLPYYYAVDDRQVINHFTTLMSSTDTPVYAYTIPSRTGNELSPGAARALAGEGLAGIKDSTKSFERHLEYLEVGSSGTDSGSFEVFMGSDAMVLDALAAGAAGSVSALANLRPDLLSALKRAFVEDDQAEAKSLQEEIAHIRAEVSKGPALSGLKAAVAQRLNAKGIAYPTRLRAPLG
jgi:dihydrodipicolinate synthase/N-acetylneuraminate lyase